MRELCVINKEMKGLCLSIQFKAYCRAWFKGRLLSSWRRMESTIINLRIPMWYPNRCTFLKNIKKY
jgi:hypothetical protein